MATTARKAHVSVSDEAILAWLEARGEAALPQIAKRFKISTATVRRRCDLLAAVGKLECVPATRTSKRTYRRAG